MAQDRGDLASAEAWYTKALKIEEEFGTHPMMGGTYYKLGRLEHCRRNLAAAEVHKGAEN